MKLFPAVLFAVLLAATASGADQTYTGTTPKAGTEARHYFLVLHDNTHAFFRTIKSWRESMIETGVWTTTDAGDVSLQFLDRAGLPRGDPLVWKRAEGVLTPLTWDLAEWGADRPPTLRRG